MTGRLDSNGASTKWRSTVWNPASISANAAGPMATISENPMAESYE